MNRFPPPAKPLLLLSLCLVLSALLFTRSPTTNFVFDEQEALLANPYVQGARPFWSAFQVDFWGRKAQETIGSYRPLPNLLWRALAFTLRANTPFYLHLLNVVLHAAVASALGRLTWRITYDRWAGWMAGLAFCSLGIAAEVVCGVVGLADILVAACAVSTLWGATLPMRQGVPLVFFSVLAGFFAKETVVGLVLPVTLFAAWQWWKKPNARAVFRSFGIFVAQGAALALAISLRRLFFPVETTMGQAAVEELPLIGRSFAVLLQWFAQPGTPIDPINNPLSQLGFVARLPSCFEVYLRGAGQLVVPVGLSGDYSFAQTTARGWTFQAYLGAALWCGTVAGGVALLGAAQKVVDAGAQTLVGTLGFGLLWIPALHLPVSNAFVLLPTVRADRLWYLPALGFCLALGGAWGLLQRQLASSRRAAAVALGVAALFLGVQATQARRHACDYRDDLAFWRATAQAAPKSAKAWLNLGVMLGARGHGEQRVQMTRKATQLAPGWPMAHVYLGDALCRRDQLQEAWPSYRKGLELAPQQKSLVALALQCLWDRDQFELRAVELGDMAARHHGTWLAYFVERLREKGAVNGGLPARYRPRGYNEGVERTEP